MFHVKHFFIFCCPKRGGAQTSPMHPGNRPQNANPAGTYREAGLPGAVIRTLHGKGQKHPTAGRAEPTGAKRMFHVKHPTRDGIVRTAPPI